MCRVSACCSFAPCHQHDAQLDYYGKKLATCSSDRTVKIFDVREGVDGQEKHTLVKELRG